MDNVYKTVDVIHYCRLQEWSPSLILSLDIEKAFDTVEPVYLMQLLDHLSFSPKFKMAVQAFYEKSMAKTQVNGQLSPPFDISRGTRQGWPHSPLLFALAIEPLAETLRNSQKYQGIQIGDKC